MSDFEIEISGESGTYWVAARSAVGETGDIPVQSPFDELTLAGELQKLETALAWSATTARRSPSREEQPAQEFGRRLFEFAFPPELRASLIASRQHAAADGTPLRIRLRVGPPELAALPWEFLYDLDRDDYLSLSTPLVRYLDVFEPRRPLSVVPPLRILAMIANPAGLEELDVEHEQRRLTDALAKLEAAGRVQLSWVDGQTWWHLQTALDHGEWHIFHFIGHGGFDRYRGEGLLALTGDDGGEHRLPASDLALLLAEQPSLRLVVLNSCDTAKASPTDRFSSTASVLLRRGIPAVAAMQYQISDQAAVSFARGFYTALAAQHPVDLAVNRARRAIKNTHPHTLEWATPVIYLRSATATLFDLTAAPPDVATRPQRPNTEPSLPTAGAIPHPSPATSMRPLRIGPTELARMTHDDAVTAVAFGPDATRVATASNDKTARVWRSTTGAELARMTHGDSVWDVVFSPDGTRVATASTDNTARVWDSATGAELARMTHDDWVWEVVFSPNGTRLATASEDNTSRVWDVTTRNKLARVLTVARTRVVARMLHDGAVVAAAFSPDGTRVATASEDDAAVRVWNPASGVELARMTHDDSVWDVVFSPDGTRVATASDDNTARVWDSATGAELARMTHDDRVAAVAFSPDGTRVATASEDNTSRVWDPVDGAELVRMTHERQVYRVLFSPDGLRVASVSGDCTARVWNPATGAELARMTHDDWVVAAAFSPEGTQLVTASNDNTARVWALSLE